MLKSAPAAAKSVEKVADAVVAPVAAKVEAAVAPVAAAKSVEKVVESAVHVPTPTVAPAAPVSVPTKSLEPPEGTPHPIATKRTKPAPAVEKPKPAPTPAPTPAPAGLKPGSIGATPPEKTSPASPPASPEVTPNGVVKTAPKRREGGLYPDPDRHGSYLIRAGGVDHRVHQNKGAKYWVHSDTGHKIHGSSDPLVAAKELVKRVKDGTLPKTAKTPNLSARDHPIEFGLLDWLRGKPSKFKVDPRIVANAKKSAANLKTSVVGTRALLPRRPATALERLARKILNFEGVASPALLRARRIKEFAVQGSLIRFNWKPGAKVPPPKLSANRSAAWLTPHGEIHYSRGTETSHEDILRRVVGAPTTSKGNTGQMLKSGWARLIHGDNDLWAAHTKGLSRPQKATLETYGIHHGLPVFDGGHEGSSMGLLYKPPGISE